MEPKNIGAPLNKNGGLRKTLNGNYFVVCCFHNYEVSKHCWAMHIFIA